MARNDLGVGNTIVITLPKALAKRLARASEVARRSPEAVARSAIADRLDYLEGRLRAIDAGFEDLERGGVTTEQVLAELDSMIRKRERKRKKAG